MSLYLYEQRLFYDEAYGGAVKNGPVIRRFMDKPDVPGLLFEGLDCAPQTHTWLIIQKFNGWREMEADEIRAAMAFIAAVV